MISKIIDIRQDYEQGTLKDGVVIVIEKENNKIEQIISGTEWSTRCTEKSFDVLGIQLSKYQITKINNLLGNLN